MSRIGLFVLILAVVFAFIFGLRKGRGDRNKDK